MKQTVIRITVLALLVASSALASSVTDIELRHEDGGVAAYIAVDGTVRFIHQVEPPKDGKPNRVIVDVLSATHALGQRNYSELPAGCNITAIRTSQYAVQPEKMVRVVFDMKDTPLYSVTAQNGAVKVFFTDNTVAPFQSWKSSAYGTPVKKQPTPATPTAAAAANTKPTADANKAIENDRLASLSTEPQPPARTPTVVAAPAEPVAAPNTPATPKARPTVVAKPKSDDAAAKPARPTVAATPKVETKTDVPSEPSVKAQPAAKPAPVQAVAKSTSATPPASTAAPKKEQPEPVAEKPAATESASTPAAAEASAPQTDAPVPPPTQTSRFRRTPTTPSKLKGTMVAEFPKRLVIKYKANRYRDPFATLINETRTNDNPIEQRVPNIEGLRLVGIIEAVDGANRALFQDKENYSYILKSGDKVKNGYVLRVESDRVYFQIFEYGWSRTVALQIEE